MVNTTKINKFMPPPVKSKKTFGYDHSQIQRIIRHMRMSECDLWSCSAVSADLRIGAIPGLSVGSLWRV